MDKANKQIMWAIIGILFFIMLLMWTLPQYQVWQKELGGKAQLKEAEWNRQIKIREAEANLEAEKLNAKSEVERAIGVAEANRIIGGSLEGNEAYLRYLWIKGLHDGSSEVIYVPTEVGMPILEAGKR